jgi:hypothetical protein
LSGDVKCTVLSGDVKFMVLSGDVKCIVLSGDVKSCHLFPLSRLGRPQSRCGRFGEEKNILPLSGVESWTVQPAACVYISHTERCHVAPRPSRPLCCSCTFTVFFRNESTCHTEYKETSFACLDGEVLALLVRRGGAGGALVGCW